MIKRIQHIGVAVDSVETVAANYSNLFSLDAVDYREVGTRKEARILFPNEVWLHLVEDSDENSRMSRFRAEHGENMEHLALEVEDIQACLESLKAASCPVIGEQVHESEDGFHLYISGENAIGFTVELIQPIEGGWSFEVEKCSNPEVLGLQHIGVAVEDMDRSISTFKRLFGVDATGLREDQHYGTQKDMMLELGNDRLWLHLVMTDDPENRVCQFRKVHGEQLEHLCIEFDDIRNAVKQVKKLGVPLEQHKIYLDRDDGFEAFVYPEYNHGITVEQIEPYEDSRGYRRRPRILKEKA